MAYSSTTSASVVAEGPARGSSLLDDPFGWAALQLFLVGVFAIPMTDLRLGGLTVSDTAMALAAGGALARTVSGGDPIRLSRDVVLSAALVTGGGVLASFEGISPLGGLFTVVRVLFVIVLFRWTASALVSSRALVARSIGAYLLGGAVSGLFAVGQTVFGWRLTSGPILGRATGLAGHPNDAGGTLAVALVLGLGAFVYKIEGQRVLRLAGLACVTVGLLLSGSLTGMISAILGALVLIVRRGLRPELALKALFGVVLAFAIGIVIQSKIGESGTTVSPVERLQQASGSGPYSESTLTLRIRTDRAGIEGILDRPIQGHGLDEDSVRVDRERLLAVHNGPILAWYAGGIVFFLGISWAIFASMRGLWRRNDALGEVLFAGAATAIVFSQTAPVLFHRYFWLPLLLLSAYKSISISPESEATSP